MTYSIPPRHQFIAGLLILPAFLLQDILWVKAVITILFIFLSLVTGKSFRLLPNLIILLSIVVINLFQPHGKVLLTLFRFPVTLGALEIGIERALTLIGMIYISRFSVRKGLILPGRLGSLLGQVFYNFERVTESWRDLPKLPIAQKLDKLLWILEEEGEVQSTPIVTSDPSAGLPTLLAYGGLFILIAGIWMGIFL
jgi:hypothetical protein